VDQTALPRIITTINNWRVQREEIRVEKEKPVKACEMMKGWEWAP
jgi:hypothetical protein